MNTEEGAAEGAAEHGTPPELQVPLELVETWPHHLVQLVAPPKAEWVARIEEQGVNVIEPISRYGLFVMASPEEARRLLRSQAERRSAGCRPFVTWSGPPQPAYRLSPETLALVGTDGRAPASDRHLPGLRGRRGSAWLEQGTGASIGSGWRKENTTTKSPS